MSKKSITVILLIAFVNLLGVSGAFARSSKAEEKAARVRESVEKLGAGEAARVTVKLADDMKLKGFISEIDDDYFVVTNPQTGQTRAIAYENVKKIRGNNLSTGAKIAIGVGVIAAALVVVILANRKVCENSLCQ